MPGRAPSSGQPWITWSFHLQLAPLVCLWQLFPKCPEFAAVFEAVIKQILNMCFSLWASQRCGDCLEAVFCFLVEQHSTNDRVDKIRDGVGFRVGSDHLCWWAGLLWSTWYIVFYSARLSCAPVKPDHTTWCPSSTSPCPLSHPLPLTSSSKALYSSVRWGY